METEKTEMIVFEGVLPMAGRYRRLAEELAAERNTTPERVVTELAGRHLQAVLDLVCSELEMWAAGRN